MVAAALAATVALLAGAGSAVAGWSTPQAFMGSDNSSGSAVAVDSRGNAAVAWLSSPNASYHASAQLMVRLASGRHLTRTVWSGQDAQAYDVSVVIGGGEVTVAWNYRNRANREAVGAAYGPLIGHWSSPQTIGRETEPASYEPSDWHPNLAVSPGGEVLLAWNVFNASHAGVRGAALAWRTPGHHFGAPQMLPTAPAGAIPQFDADGNAYLAGSCNAQVLIARAHTHHFRTVVVTSTPVSDFTLSLAGARQGLASWLPGPCSFDAMVANPTGPVFASVLRAGAFGKPLALTPADTQAVGCIPVAVPGGGTATWLTTSGSSRPAPALPYTTLGFSVQFDAHGIPGATHQIVADEALAADGGGDVLFGPPASGFFTPAGPVLVRPAGGGADQPAPGPMRPDQVAVAAPIGRAAALTWHRSPTGGGPAMEISVWHP